MRKKIIAANWKMHGNKAFIKDLVQTLLNSAKILDQEIIIFPPAIYLPLVAELIVDSKLSLGAQNIYPKESGPYTGEISASMLKDYNCQYVLIGHSERRQIFKEDENFIASKFHHTKEHGMIPILCVGETIVERENKLTEAVIEKQILTIASEKNSFAQSIIAYEPVWAIGTNKAASPDQAEEVHAYIRSLLTTIDETTAKNIPLLYGGSIKQTNAKALFAMPNIDGGLVGAASLDANQFLEIIQCIN